MNVIDALKALGKNERFARDLANKEKLIAMGIDRSNIFMVKWDLNVSMRQNWFFLIDF